MKKIIITIIILLLLGLTTTGIILFLNKTKEPSIKFDEEMTLEVNTSHTIKELVTIEDGELLNGDDEIDTKKVGTITVEVKYKDLKEEEKTKSYKITIKDTMPPEVEGVKDLTIYVNNQIDFYKDLVITDNSNDEITKEVIGEYDTKKVGTYDLSYSFKDSSGNETTKEFKLTVKEAVITNSNSSTYYVKVNKTMNVVMVYTKDENGDYTKLVKTMVCSAGNGTPVGKFNTSAKYETLSLVGNVWGHYTVQIKGVYWFHSVPYYSKADSNGNWTDLEYEEYNKLGTLASKGCIRLAVADSKWIYDNIPKGTTVEIYESDELPEGVTKPTPITIDVNDEERRGWDPTDPDPDNPWK